MKAKQKMSPMMKHYLSVKEQYPDAIILYRLGDFYEMFFEDAKTASKVLDLTLTGRDCGLPERAPMCGVPHHAVDNYIAKLIEQGFHVAICEQMTTPAESKGMVEREVVRVITPGTLIEENILSESKSNYIACVYLHENSAAIAWSDVSTGEFRTTELTGFAEMENMLLTIQPAEIICNEEVYAHYDQFQLLKQNRMPSFYKCNGYSFAYESCKNTLLDHFSIGDLAVFEIKDRRACVSASGGLIKYLQETQKRALKHINKIKLEQQARYMLLDPNTRRNLELTETMREKKKRGSLFGVLDRCETNMGKRKLRRWVEQPLVDEVEINARLNAVEALLSGQKTMQELEELLENMRDIERLVSKIAYGSINPKECIAISDSLKLMPEIRRLLEKSNDRKLIGLAQQIEPLEELSAMLDASIDENASALMKDGGFIKKGFNAQLDEFRSAKYSGKKWIAELEAREREDTGIKTLKIGYNRVFGYYIEVSNSYSEKVPYRYVRKQTLSNNERYITDELKRYEETILNAEDNAIKLENQIYAVIKQQLEKVIPELQANASAVSECDILLSFAKLARDKRYVKPVIGAQLEGIVIKDGRHPVVENLLAENQFVPNDTLLDGGANRTLVITGPNMAGKSTYMRQTAIIILMAHIGCFVPAKSAEIAITDRIFTRVGASDDLAFGQSTFMVEMIEVATILHNATPKSLVILDEIGRGTSTYDGLSIAWAVLEFVTLHIQARTLFSTHYHELAELEGMLEGVKNYKIIVKESASGIVFLHKIMRGGANKSFGIEVASLAGVPQEVIERAKQFAQHLESQGGGRDTNALMLENLNQKNGKQMNVFDFQKSDEIARILADLDLNSLTPMQALMVLSDLKEKVRND